MLMRALSIHRTVAPCVSIAPSTLSPLSRLASGILAQCCDDEKRYGARVVPTCTQRLENETAPALAGAVGPRLLTSGVHKCYHHHGSARQVPSPAVSAERVIAYIDGLKL